MFGSRKELQRELHALDTGERIAVQLTIGGVGTRYLVIREDTLRDLVEKAGCDLKPIR